MHLSCEELVVGQDQGQVCYCGSGGGRELVAYFDVQVVLLVGLAASVIGACVFASIRYLNRK